MKLCHQCKKEKPLSAFFSDTKGRKFSPCRECRIERKRLQREADKENFRAKDRAWYALNRERVSARKRAYAKTEKYKEQKERWKEKNPHYCANFQKQLYRKWRLKAMLALGGLKCNESGCLVSGDQDVLEIDHVRNDGHIERKKMATMTMLRQIANSPDKTRYQVLCANHNRKKRLLNLRNGEGK